MAKEKKQLKQLSDEELEQVTGGTQRKIELTEVVGHVVAKIDVRGFYDDVN